MSDAKDCPCGGWDCSSLPGGPMHGCPYVAAPRWHAVDEKGNDNFATSIYETNHDGLLIARCNQNGQYPWQGAAIIRGLEQNKAIPAPNPPGPLSKGADFASWWTRGFPKT